MENALKRLSTVINLEGMIPMIHASKHVPAKKAELNTTNAKHNAQLEFQRCNS